MNLTCPNLGVSRLMMIETFGILVLALFALWSNVLLIRLLPKTTLIPGNVRLLLRNTFMGHVVTNTFYFQLIIFICLAAIMPHGFNDLMLDSRLCGIMALLHPLGGIMADVMVASIGIERAVVYFFCNSKEEHEKSTLSGRILVAMSWLVGILCSIMPSVVLSSDSKICFCHVVLAWPPYLVWFVCVSALVTPLVGLLLFMLVFVQTRRTYNHFGINTASSTLSRRFVLYINIRTTRSLWPTIVLITFICPIVMSSWLWLHQSLRDYPTTASVNLFLFTHYPLILYLSLSPLIVLIRHKSLQKTLMMRHPKTYLLLQHLFNLFNDEMNVDENGYAATVLPIIVDHKLDSQEAQHLIESFWMKSIDNSHK